jgi:hypothetical protein
MIQKYGIALTTQNNSIYMILLKYIDNVGHSLIAFEDIVNGFFITQFTKKEIVRWKK